MKKPVAYVITVVAAAVVGFGVAATVIDSTGHEESSVQNTPASDDDPSDEIADLEEPVVEGPSPSSTADFQQDAVGDPLTRERPQRLSGPTVGGNGWVADSSK